MTVPAARVGPGDSHAEHVYQETDNSLGGAFTVNVAVHNTNVNGAGERFSIHVRLHVTVSATGVERVIDEASFTSRGSSR